MKTGYIRRNGGSHMKKTVGFVVMGGHLDIEWYQPMNSYRFWTVEALDELKRLCSSGKDIAPYCLDGQFFPLKEYLDAAPEERDAVQSMVDSGKLVIGPFYTQFDEWLPSAEAMIRNCLYGARACREFGRPMKAGYLPDNFGHPLQMPQILRGFGIDSLLFMRGMPEVPGGHDDEFTYIGPDGSELFASHFRESYSGAFDIFSRDILPTQPREVPYYGEYQSYEYHRELAEHTDPDHIAKSMIGNVLRIRERYPSGVVPLIASADHLPPQGDMMDTIRLANSMQDDIEFVAGGVEAYVRLARSRLPGGSPGQRYNMELIGSRYQYVLLGALSTRSYLKRDHFACEALLEKYAEPLDAIALLYGHGGRRNLLDEAWRHIMINSAHDSIHGSSTDEVHAEMQARYASARQIAAGYIHDSMKHIAASLPAWGNGDDELLVMSPYGGLQMAEVWAPVRRIAGEEALDRLALADEKGSLLPVQVEPRPEIELNGRGEPRSVPFPGGVFEKILFMGNTRPFDLARYRLTVMKEPFACPFIATDTHMENRFIRVDCRGALIDITDKRTGLCARGLNLIEEEADAGDAWDFSVPWTEGEKILSSSFPFTSRLTECGPVRAAIEVKGIMSLPAGLIGDERDARRVDMPLRFTISLYDGVPRVDVRLTLENTAKDHRLRLRLHSPVKTGFVQSQSALAVIDRPVVRPEAREEWHQPPTRLLPCRESIALQDGEKGLAVALKGMYDYEAAYPADDGCPDVWVTLLRGIGMMGRINMSQRKGSASPAVPTPGAQCLGTQVMEWSYIPYKADPADKVPYLGEADRFLYPPVVHAVRGTHEGNETLRPAPFVLTGGRVRFSAFKRCLEGEDFVLRLFESQGRETDEEILLDRRFESAWLADMDEQPVRQLELKDHRLKLTFTPYKAITVLLKEADEKRL